MSSAFFGGTPGLDTGIRTDIPEMVYFEYFRCISAES